MAERVVWSVEGGVADVRMNRPDKMNALDQAMFDGLVEAGEALKKDKSIRAVVLSGEGRAFCAGLDFGSFQAMAGGGADTPSKSAGTVAKADPVGDVGDVQHGRITHKGQQAVYTWQELDVPVIAAVHGVALGGG